MPEIVSQLFSFSLVASKLFYEKKVKMLSVFGAKSSYPLGIIWEGEGCVVAISHYGFIRLINSGTYSSAFILRS
jgi:hypothetical protein